MTEIVEWPAQHYVGITRSVTMTTIPDIADRIPEIAGWLDSKDLAPAGAPFLRYLVVDMGGALTVEAGFPVAAPVEGDDVVHAGTLPAGRYATVTHHGHPNGLPAANEGLLKWAAANDVALDVSTEADGQHWECRLERYHTHPGEQPDMNKWETVVAIKLA